MGSKLSKGNEYDIVHLLYLAEKYCARHKVRSCKILSDLKLEALEPHFKTRYPSSKIRVENNYVIINYSEEDYLKIKK